ncbi:MAG: NAD(P)/FAD-dependent oxidoreductase [Acidobacteriota bacterium]
MTDLVIVGGGPAGLGAAIACRLQGLSVSLLEQRRPPLDKPCGEGLMPDGVACLERFGVRVTGRPFRGIRYCQSDGTIAEGDFPAGHGLGVRRPALHQAMVQRAEALGVELLWGSKVETIEARGEQGVEVVSGDRRRLGRYLVAADGLRSPLRRWAGLAGKAAQDRRFGVRQHFRCAPWSERVEVHWAENAEAYITPVAADEVGVAILWRRGKATWEQLLARFPTLAERLAGCATTSRARGCGPLRQRVRGVRRDRTLLLGDAAGYVDAITGEGMSLALHQAEALADAVASGRPQRYERACRRLRRLPDAMTELLLALEKRPALRRRALRALARERSVFDRLLAIHCRALPPSQLGLVPATRLVWRFATGR